MSVYATENWLTLSGTTFPVEPMKMETWGTAIYSLVDGQIVETYHRMGRLGFERPLIVFISGGKCGPILASGVALNEDSREVGFLLASADLGRTWTELSSAPDDIYGAMPRSENDWIAWGRDRLYFSEDRGETWRPVEMPARHFRGGPLPLLAQDGSVFIFLKDAERFQRLFIVAPDFTTETVAGHSKPARTGHIKTSHLSSA